jgi:hypothetical protein
MRTPKPRPLSQAEQLEAGRQRFDAEAEGARRRADTAIKAVDDENMRLDRLMTALGVVPFESVPQAKPWLEIARVLRHNRDRIQDERDLLSIERYLSGGMSASGVGAPKGPKAKEFAERRDQLKKKLKVSTVEAPPRQPDVVPPEVRAGIEVFAPIQAAKAPKSYETRLAELSSMEDVVSTAIFVNTSKINDLRSDVGFEQAQRLKGKNDELLVGIFRCSQRLAEAYEQQRQLRAAYVRGGYTTRNDVLPGPEGLTGALLLMGVESDWNSQLSQYRKFLQARGLLP